MEINIKSNVKKFKRELKDFQKKQIPFATSRALNQTGQLVLKQLQRKASTVFEGGATASTLRVFNPPGKGKTLKGNYYNIRFSTKRDLTTTIKLPDWAENYLKYQIDGGTRTKKGIDLFIPTRNINVNKFGNIPGKQSKVRGNTKNTFVGEIKGIKGLWKRHGKGKNKSVKLLIAFEDTAQYQKKFHYYDYTNKIVAVHFKRKMQISLAQAIKTAK